MARQRADITAPLAERGQDELCARQRIEQVLAEMTGLDQLVERAGAGRNNADIDALADRPADHLDLAVVDEFEEFRLSFERDAFDMVDDDAAAVGLDKAPDLTLEGPRKGDARREKR